MPEILDRLMPAVPEQLESMGFRPNDFNPFLEIIRERLATRQTGSLWQLNKLAELRNDMHKRDALVEMLHQYQKNSAANIPVAQWK